MAMGKRKVLHCPPFFDKRDVQQVLAAVRRFLSPPHEILDFVVVADKEKSDLVRELKKDAVLEACPDLPVVPMPVLEAEARRQCGLSIQVLHESVDGLINLLLTGGGELFETAVKAGFKLVSHFTSSSALDACEQLGSLGSGCRAPFSIDQAWPPASCNRRR